MATYSGTIDLRVTGDAEEKAKKIERSVKSIKDLARGLKPVPNLFDNRTQDKDIRKAKEELKKLVGEYGKGTGAGKRFSNTLAGLNSQVSAFGKIIGNVNTNSDEFVSAITAQEKASRRLAKAEAERLKVQAQVNTANTVGRATSVQETLDLGKVVPKSIAGLELYQRELQETFRNVEIGTESYKELRNEILRVNALMRDFEMNAPALSSPIGGRANIPGSPAALAADRNARAQRRSQRTRDVLTGAGFPLLFGGGPVQALAGGVGGAFGGLGGSIAASAIASQVEAFVTATAQVGQALNSTGGALDFVREKSLFSKAGNEELAAQLEEQGDVAGLAALLTEELVDKIGNNGVEALQDLGTETDETTRLWNELTLQLQALIASNGPLRGFIDLLNNLLGGLANRGRLAALQKDLEGTEAGRRLGAEIERIRPEASFVDEFLLGSGQADLTDTQVADLLKRFTPSRPKDADLPITDKDQRRFSKSGDKAAREAERVKQRIDALRREREEIIAISGIKDKIALAEAANDSQLVIRLQGQQRLRQIETERLNDLAKAKTAEEARAINQTAVVKALAAQLETGRQLTEDQRQRQELFEDTLEGLQHQLDMAEATSQAERDRLKIAREMKKLKDKGFTDDQVAQAGGIMERLAVAQQPLNAFIRKTTEDLNNLQQVAVDVSQGIGNAIGSSLVNGLQSLVTGAASIKEVFANMLKSVADVLANTAAKMIAQYIAIGIARMFAGMDGGESQGAHRLEGVQASPAVKAGYPGNLNYAEGGYVSGPTRALVGEGGEPEYVIPESKMRESMARYSRGARGGSVVPESGAGGTSEDGGGTAVAAPIDVRYTVERINSVDYVTADQFQAGMRQAANQGAKQGEQQTLKRLQMSGGTRRRLGM